MKMVNCFKAFVLTSFLVILCVLLGCSQQNDENEVQQNRENSVQTDFYQTEIGKIVAEFQEKYNAIDYMSSTEGLFSADIVDMYKSKNLLATIFSVADIIYIENDLYMYAEELFGYNQFLLKITEEQYSKIKTFESVTNPNDYNFASTLYIVFSLDNIEAEFSTLDAWFDFSLGTDNTLADYDLYDSVYSKIIKGTLIDIIEVK